MIVIDGSIMEGGGQILRIALACSALTSKPVKVFNIRAGRQKSGLAAQHLKGLELVRDICQAKVSGAFLGSMEIEFRPSGLKGGRFFADTQTAGSVALLLQVALPVSYFCNTPVTLELRGGTNAEMAPQIDFMTEILRPNIEKFGATFDFDLKKRGYFPRGGGSCTIDVKPITQLKSADITEFGTVERFFGWSYVAGSLPIKMAQEFAEGAKSSIKGFGLNQIIDIEVYKESPDMAIGNCSGIILGCTTSGGCTLGGSALGSRKETCEQSGKRAAQEVLDTVLAKACVDQYVQDQLILFMALAAGRSRVRCGFPLTLHTTTAIHITETIADVKFNIIEQEDGNPTCIIECDGIGLMNKFV